ncbi:SPOR domain-containing protein [Flavobacterium gilvum]|uniref:Sporulation protein n=1 Tax=Flavobacterium gilvum TaxID=1492737 RepID=A0AAC9I2R0_9FLAO|nr:SPOR domain-containing protein [Flavobacterium gilvum]AOW09151.1 sporulation protein [Flavobacterium gilvum]KFC60872.1 sporulation protein [Flavobacterium gilvum]
MRFLKISKTLFTAAILLTITSRISAQNTNTEVSQDPKFEQLLNDKRKSNPNLSYSDRYKIQIFNGAGEGAKKALNEFRLEFKNIDGTIVFNTPNYKVWVGNFRTRMEAERNLAEIQKYYKNVFLIKPSK